MKAFTMFVVAVAAVVMAGVPAHGRTQPAMFCWSPDAEFPVACEEEEEEDGYTRPSGRADFERSCRPMNGCQTNSDMQTE